MRTVFVFLAVATLLPLSFLGYKKTFQYSLELSPPHFSLIQISGGITFGPSKVSLHVSDSGAGISEIICFFKSEEQVTKVLKKTFSPPAYESDIDIIIPGKESPVGEGSVLLRCEARDATLFSHQGSYSVELPVSFKPPSGKVVFVSEVSEPGSVGWIVFSPEEGGVPHEVRAGWRDAGFYPLFPQSMSHFLKKRKLISIPFVKNEGMSQEELSLIAKDKAGNRTNFSLTSKKTLPRSNNQNQITQKVSRTDRFIHWTNNQLQIARQYVGTFVSQTLITEHFHLIPLTENDDDSVLKNVFSDLVQTQKRILNDLCMKESSEGSDIPSFSSSRQVTSPIYRAKKELVDEEREISLYTTDWNESILSPPERDVYAEGMGKVIYMGEIPFFGKTIGIKYQGPFCSFYGNVDQSILKIGTIVQPGDHLGRVTKDLLDDEYRLYEAHFLGTSSIQKLITEEENITPFMRELKRVLGIKGDIFE